MIDLDSLIPGSAYFRFREALWCKGWRVHVYPTPEQYRNILKMAQIMDFVRGRIDKPVIIESWLRPPIYNELVKGAKNSAHCEGRGVDFRIVTVSADEVRQDLLPHLERLKIRMEDLPGSSWVHVDSRDPGREGKRFFKP